MFSWLTSDNIRQWATQINSIEHLPAIIQRLIRSMSAGSTFINFQTGRQIFIEGNDGYVNSIFESHFVPEGVSIWELGTSPDSQGKANRDYKNRTEKPNGYDPKTSSFIFITPHSWPGKQDWATAKKAKGEWLDVKAYDCTDLSSWLNESEVVAYDYAEIFGGIPRQGVLSATDAWNEWSSGPDNLLLPPEILIAGREYLIDEFRKFLAGTASVRAIRASSFKESIAFIIACAKVFEEDERLNFFSKAIVVKTEDAFRYIYKLRQRLIIITEITDNMVYAAAGKNHHVFVALGPSDPYNGDVFDLPRLQKEGMIKALARLSIDEEKAERMIREAGYNITILRKLLYFNENEESWAKPENAQKVIPALLVGRWNEDKPGDKEVLAALAGKSYEAFINDLVCFADAEIPLYYQIGKTWRLASPLDAWSSLSKSLTSGNLEKLKVVALEVLRITRPALNLPAEKREMAEIMGDKLEHSSWLREGLIQSLTLISIYGSNFSLPQNYSQNWVDQIVYSLLHDAEGKLWSTLNYSMPLIAEASPSSFLKVVEESISKDHPELMAMFEEEPSMLFPKSHHTGLLWALESLAWIPAYLTRVTLLLGKLTSLDPGGKISNRPSASLRSIFLPWFPQTFASMEERMEVIRTLNNKQPETGWRVMLSLLPRHHDTAHPTHKTRWRLFNEMKEEPEIDRNKSFQNHTLLIEEMLKMAGTDENKLGLLLSYIPDLQTVNKNTVLDYVENNKEGINQISYAIWNEARELLSQHRSHQDTHWALREPYLSRLQTIYDYFYPADVVEKFKWLFNENWPSFPEGIIRSYIDHDKHQQYIDEKRKEAAVAIYSEYGISKLVELAEIVKEKFYFGYAVGEAITEEQDIFSFLSNDSLADDRNYVMKGFIHAKNMLGFEYTSSIYRLLISHKYTNEALGNYLSNLTQNKMVWDLVDSQNKEIIKKYWSVVIPRIYQKPIEEKIYVIENLLEANRGWTAISEASHGVQDYNSALLIATLNSAVHSTERSVNGDYEVVLIFNELDKRADVSTDQIAQLEWSYLNILAASHSHRKPKVLYDELSSKPSVFIDFLKLVYKSKDDPTDISALPEAEREQVVSRARHAYHLLHSWIKLPGSSEDGKIDEEILKKWVEDVLALANEVGRLNPALIHIGRIFANYPETSEQSWPPKVIAEIIDNINSDILSSNFSSGIFNKYGSSTKSPFEGGNRERKLAEKFQEYALRIQNNTPVTASILAGLANGYLEEAKREDERAKRDSLEN